MTIRVEVIIQAVSPLLMTGAAGAAAASAGTASAAAGAAAEALAAGAAGASSAHTKEPTLSRPKPSAREIKNFFMVIFLFSAWI
jgi:hypothetical protein